MGLVLLTLDLGDALEPLAIFDDSLALAVFTCRTKLASVMPSSHLLVSMMALPCCLHLQNKARLGDALERLAVLRTGLFVRGCTESCTKGRLMPKRPFDA